MAELSKEQAASLKAEMIAKRDAALADYNRCVGAINMLNLVDGSIDIVEEKKPDGETP